MNAPKPPKFAQTVMVPLANPKTAPHLLKLATSLEDPETGRVIALTVSLGDSERESKAIEELEPIVEGFREKGENIEHLTVNATSIARGILDTVREHRVDLLILGVLKPIRGQVEMGTIVENVLAAATCDVVIYRAAQDPSPKRVVMWANGSQPARIAAHVAIQIAQTYDVSCVGMYVQSIGRDYFQGLARVEQTVDGIPGGEKVKRTVFNAQDLLAGMMARLDENDMMVVGFARRTDMQKWLYGDFSQQLLNRAPGPVVLTSRAETQTSMANQYRLALNWLRPVLTQFEREEIVRQAQEQARPSLDFVVLTLVATLIASLGLLLNSAAVIIGAMLVAPLMQPIITYSVGMTTGRIRLMRRALATMFIGITLAFLIGILLGLIIPNRTLTPEMMGRTNPTLLDAGVAIVSGIAGAYATARKGIPAALAGVAIAAALVPPIGTAGLMVAFNQPELAFGAILLFTMNIVYISLAGWGVFFWLGMRPLKLEIEEGDQGNYRRYYISAGVVATLIIPMMMIFLSLSDTASQERRIEAELEDFFAPADVTIDDYEDVTIDGEDGVRVLAIVRSNRTIFVRDIEAAQAELAEAIDQPVQLELITERVRTAP